MSLEDEIMTLNSGRGRGIAEVAMGRRFGHGNKDASLGSQKAISRYRRGHTSSFLIIFTCGFLVHSAGVFTPPLHRHGPGPGRVIRMIPIPTTLQAAPSVLSSAKPSVNASKHVHSARPPEEWIASLREATGHVILACQRQCDIIQARCEDRESTHTEDGRAEIGCVRRDDREWEALYPNPSPTSPLPPSSLP
ncbi:hypothetical protein FIBSPDRAFT_938228 [Athelia psychrophila]|uniref:Uncharacterized protein n=1 Tax=Athelia psychrophila TaxID=1759441 RepID=A0A165YX67_9AGAM|nr:hypothetical protein FIBSPDRAFT_938228 [Fibularhizoctonia sp. CBS 109695]